MLPADRTLQEMAAGLRDAQRRIERLETLEAPTLTAGLVCLETIQVTTEVASVTFSAIDQNFLHLWLWILSKTPATAGGCVNRMTFNGDTNSNYRFLKKNHVRDEDLLDTEIVTGGTGTTNDLVLGGLAGNPNWAACEVNILNYALFNASPTLRTIIWKAWRMDTPGAEIDPFVSLEHGGGEWINTTDPITSIIISAGGGGCKFAVGSLLSLMGVCAI